MQPQDNDVTQLAEIIEGDWLIVVGDMQLDDAWQFTYRDGKATWQGTSVPISFEHGAAVVDGGDIRLHLNRSYDVGFVGQAADVDARAGEGPRYPIPVAVELYDSTGDEWYDTDGGFMYQPGRTR